MEQKTKSGFSLYVNSNENIQNALFLREKKKKYRMGLIIAFVVVCICTIFAYRYRTYHRMKVVKTITKELTESFQSFAYKKANMPTSSNMKKKKIKITPFESEMKNGIKHIPLRIHRHLIVGTIL